VKLRDYQRRAIDEMETAFNAGTRGLFLVMPTGAGKTVVFTEWLKSRVEAGQRAVVLAHRGELIKQAGKTINANGMYHGVIKACDSTFPLAPIQVASIDSMRSRELPWHPDLIVVDEAHLVKSNRYMTFLAKYPDAQLLMVSATPIRLDNRGFHDLADAIVIGSTINELIEHPEGPFLVPPVLYTGSHLKGLEKVKTLAGEYNQGALESFMATTSLVGDVVEQYRLKAFGRKGVVFCVGIGHSKLVCEQFNAAGIPAEHIDGTTPEGQRDAILGRLKTGQTMIVTNANVLCEGWDEPSVSYVGLCRPTKSLALYIQQAGRGLRICPEIGKENCVIIDHAGNMAEHGHILEERAWSLDGMAGVKKAKGKKNYKECPACDAWLTLLAQSCDYCGYTYPAPKINVIHADFTQAEAPKEYPMLIKEYRAFLRMAKATDRKAGWAYFRVRDKYGVDTTKAQLSYRESQKHIKECYGVEV